MTPAEVSDEMDDCIGWEAKIARYATYYPAAGNSIATDVECVAPATTQNPPLVEGINWLVGAVNDGYVPLNPDVRTPLGGYQPQVAESIIRANLGQPVTLAAATPAVAGSTSINVPAVELDLYQSLGQSTPNSQFELLVSVPGTVYGSPHAVPGDVDNSGCTNQADLNQILQSDVWLHQAPAAVPARRYSTPRWPT